MATLPQAANTDGNKESMNDFSALPAGEYTAVIIKSQYKETKAKTGHYLQLQFKVIEGEQKGRMLFENLNLDNPNPIAVEIANKELNSICQACGKAAVSDSEELHNIPIRMTLKVDKATATQPASNSATKFEAYDGEITTVEEPTAKAPVAGGKAKKLPWD